MTIHRTVTPLYQGIVDDLVRQIGDGRLPPGEQVPSLGELMARYGVSAITAKRAVAELRRAGLVYSIQGRGTFVVRRLDRPAVAGPAKCPPLRSIGLVSSTTDAVKARSFFTEIWQGVERATKDHGLDFAVQILPDTTPDEHVQIMFKPDPARGMVFVASSHPYRVLPLVVEQSIRTVMIDSALPFSNCVLTDNLDGMKQLLDHLTGLGHRSIALAARHPRSPNPTNENERVAAFEFLTRELNAPVLPGDDFDAILRRTTGRSPISAVIFTQDDPAIEFLSYAKERGLRIPRDLSITGFDGWSHGHSSETLTTLCVDRIGLGRAAVDLLHSPDLPDALHSRWVRIPGHLAVGQTTARRGRKSE